MNHTRSAHPHPKISTTVRALIRRRRRTWETESAPALAVTAARVGMRALSRSSPDLASRWAERMFLTARRHRQPSRERELLAGARELSVAVPGGSIPVWILEPAGVIGWRPTVLFVHGWEGRGAQLGAIAQAVLERGLRAVLFDAPGHGGATAPRASVVEHARAIALVGETLGPIHGLVAHSVGGAAALLATRMGFSAARFALLAPPVGPSRFIEGFRAQLQVEDDVYAGMVARIERRYGIRFDELDARSDAERLSSPLLVVHDEGDRVVPLADGAAIAAAAPRADLRRTKGLGHTRILRDPDVVRSVADWAATGAPPTPFESTLEGQLFARGPQR